MYRALVIGACGFIGHHLTRHLLEKDWKVFMVDDLSSGKEDRFGLVPAERRIMQNGMDVLPMVDTVDVVFNMAAARPNWEFVRKYPEKTLRSNVELPVALGMACKKNNIPLIHSSSSSIYGWSHDDVVDYKGITENAPHLPANTYGFQKATADSMLRDIDLSTGALLHYFNVFGPGQDSESPYTGVVTKFLEQKANNQPLTIYGDGSQSRDFTYVGDVVDAIWKAYEYAKRSSGLHGFNIGSGNPVSVSDIADAISDFQKYVDRPTGDVQKTHANTDKAKRELGWEPGDYSVLNYIEDALADQTTNT